MSVCRDKTSSQIQTLLGNGASLLLGRVSAWLRLTYLVGDGTTVQLEALLVFLRAHGDQFLMEFVESSGLETLVELLSLPRLGPKEVQLCLVALRLVVEASRELKLRASKMGAILVTLVCLEKAKETETLQLCRVLLLQFGRGNKPKWAKALHHGLLAVLRCPNHFAQEAAAQTLRLLNSEYPLSASDLPLVLGLYRTPVSEVQFEGDEIIRLMVTSGPPALAKRVIAALVGLLNPASHVAVDEMEAVTFAAAAGATKGRTVPPGFVAQAAAAHVLPSVFSTSFDLAMYAVEQDVVVGLLNGMANNSYYPAQEACSTTLFSLVRLFPEVEQGVQIHLGMDFFRAFMRSPESVCRDLDADALDILRYGFDVDEQQQRRVEGMEAERLFEIAKEEIEAEHQDAVGRIDREEDERMRMAEEAAAQEKRIDEELLAAEAEARHLRQPDGHDKERERDGGEGGDKGKEKQQPSTMYTPFAIHKPAATKVQFAQASGLKHNAEDERESHDTITFMREAISKDIALGVGANEDGVSGGGDHADEARDEEDGGGAAPGTTSARKEGKKAAEPVPAQAPAPEPEPPQKRGNNPSNPGGSLGLALKFANSPQPDPGQWGKR